MIGGSEHALIGMGCGLSLGATARTLREELERCESVHLCREGDCTQPGAVHCKAYAAVDSEAVVDLGAYGRFGGWRCLVLLWRGMAKAKRWTCSWCTCCSTRPTSPRRISEQGVLRALDPDFESEAEVASDPCEAVLVGLELQGKPRALAPDGCEDRAAPEPTRLMEGDVHLSGLGGRVTARLCNHHNQLHLLSCQGRKCSVVSCFDKVHGAHKWIPLCMKHLSETGRSNSPAPKARQTHGCGAGRWKHDHRVEKATHRVCPKCLEEVSVRRNQCPACQEYRTKGAELVNNGQQLEEIVGHPRAATAPVVLNRRAAVDGDQGFSLAAEATAVPPDAPEPENEADLNQGDPAEPPAPEAPTAEATSEEQGAGDLWSGAPPRTEPEALLPSGLVRLEVEARPWLPCRRAGQRDIVLGSTISVSRSTRVEHLGLLPGALPEAPSSSKGKPGGCTPRRTTPGLEAAKRADRHEQVLEHRPRDDQAERLSVHTTHWGPLWPLAWFSGRNPASPFLVDASASPPALSLARAGNSQVLPCEPEPGGPFPPVRRHSRWLRHGRKLSISAEDVGEGVPPEAETDTSARRLIPRTTRREPGRRVRWRRRKPRSGGIEKEWSDLEKKLRGLNATQQRSVLERL